MSGRTGTAGSIERVRVRFVAGRLPILDEKIVDVRRLLRAGRSDAQIGDEFGVDRNTVTYFIRRRGLVRPYRSRAAIYKEIPPAEVVPKKAKQKPAPPKEAPRPIVQGLRGGLATLGVVDVQRIVGTYFGIPRADLLGTARHRPVCRARQIAMVLSREYTGASLPRIGQMFGGKDHTTILHACQRMPGYIEADPVLAADVEKVRQIIVAVICENKAAVMGDQAWAEFEGRV